MGGVTAGGQWFAGVFYCKNSSSYSLLGSSCWQSTTPRLVDWPTWMYWIFFLHVFLWKVSSNCWQVWYNGLHWLENWESHLHSAGCPSWQFWFTAILFLLTTLTNEILHLWVVMQIRWLWILKLVLLPWGNRRKGYSMTYLQLKVSCTHCCPCLVGWIPFDFPCCVVYSFFPFRFPSSFSCILDI